MEAIKNGLRKNLTPAQLWSGARFFLLLNLGLIIYAVALNFYCAPNHFVFGGTTGLSIVLATCFPALLLHAQLLFQYVRKDVSRVAAFDG